MAPVPTASKPSLLRLVTEAVTQRMIGWSAGLPNSGLPNGGLPSDDSMLNKKGMNQTGVIPLRGESPGIFQPTGTTVRIRGWEQHPVVSACVREIVNLASAVPLEFYRKVPNPVKQRDDFVVLPTTFPGNRLVSTPSTLLSSMRLRQLTMTHWIIYGNAFWYLERPRPDAPPTSLRVIHPEDVYSVYVNNAGYPIWYMWRDVLGYPHTSPVTDIIHFRDLSAKSIVFGYPRAASALNDILGDNEASQYVREVVTNHGAPFGFALVEEGTSVEEARVAEERLHAKLVDRGQRGRFLFMGGVTDVKSLAFDLRELEFPDLRRVAREDICAAIGVDPRMVGITSASRDSGLSGTQYTEARRRLVAQTVEPMMRAMESELDMWFAPEFGDVYTRFNPDSLRALIEDDTETSDRITKEVASGLISVEEAREALDRPSAFRPGDTLAIPVATQIIPAGLQLIPSGPDGQPLPSVPQPTPGATAVDAGTTSGGGAPSAAPNKPLAVDAGLDPNRPNDPPKVTDGSTIAAPKRIAPPPLRRGMIQRRGIVLSKDQRQMLWGQFDQRATKEEAPYRRTALVLFAEERHAVGRIFEALDAQHPDAPVDGPAKSAKRQVAMMYTPGGVVEQRWADKFNPLIGQTYAKGYDHVTQSVKRSGPDTTDPAPDVQISFHLQDATAIQAIKDRVIKLAQLVGQTTADQIAAALEIGIREGMSMAEIAKLIDQTVFGSSASYRAMMIARTETIGALNQGQFDAAYGNDYVGYKEWLTQGDDRVRDSHAECEDEGAIPIDEIFHNGLLHPGAQDGPPDEVINCRCTLLYYDSDPNDDGARSRRVSRAALRVSERFNPYHDATGEFASGGGGTAVGGEDDTKDEPWLAAHKEHMALLDSSKKASDALAEHGGFTLHDNLSADGDKGYFVSMAGHEQQVSAKDMNAWQLLDYRDEKLPLLAKDPSLRIGGWYNPDDKKVYLDLSKRFSTKDAAIEFGKKNQQIAGYDSHKGETFDIGGRSVHTPLGLTPEQETARLTAMFSHPVQAPTLRTAPTVAEVDAHAEQKSARFNPFHDANGQFASGPGGAPAVAVGAATAEAHGGQSSGKKTIALTAGEKNIGKTPKELGWPTKVGGVDISGQRVLTKYDAPDILAARQRAASMVSTDQLPGREELHKTVLDTVYGSGAAKKNRVCDIVIGGPGSGKSSMVAEPIARDHGSLLIDSDEVKKHLPEFDGGRGAPRVQNESANLAEGPLLARAMKNGDNIVIPKVGKSAATIVQISNELHAHGYTVNLHYVDVNTETQVERSLGRFRSSGRFVDPSYVLSVDGHPRETFQSIKSHPTFKSVDYYDNNGKSAVLHKIRVQNPEHVGLTRAAMWPSDDEIMANLRKYRAADPKVGMPLIPPDEDAMCLATLKLLPKPEPGKPKTS